MADEDQRRFLALRTPRNSSSRKAERRSASSEDVGSSAITSSGRADQRARRRHALLLPDAQLGHRAPQQRVVRHVQMLEQPQRFRPHAPADRSAWLLAPLREAAGQADVLHHRQVRNEVEHLEDEADVVGTEAIARGAAQRAEFVPEHLDAACWV